MCKKCGKTVNQTFITRLSTCEFCGADLHSCINCKFYSPESHYQCHETIDELVSDKERANFCDYFVISALSGTSKDNKDKANEARAAFEALFK